MLRLVVVVVLALCRRGVREWLGCAMITAGSILLDSTGPALDDEAARRIEERVMAEVGRHNGRGG